MQWATRKFFKLSALNFIRFTLDLLHLLPNGNKKSVLQWLIALPWLHSKMCKVCLMYVKHALNYVIKATLNAWIKFIVSYVYCMFYTIGYTFVLTNNHLTHGIRNVFYHPWKALYLHITTYTLNKFFLKRMFNARYGKKCPFYVRLTCVLKNACFYACNTFSCVAWGQGLSNLLCNQSRCTVYTLIFIKSFLFSSYFTLVSFLKYLSPCLYIFYELVLNTNIHMIHVLQWFICLYVHLSNMKWLHVYLSISEPLS